MRLPLFASATVPKPSSPVLPGHHVCGPAHTVPQLPLGTRCTATSSSYTLTPSRGLPNREDQPSAFVRSDHAHLGHSFCSGTLTEEELASASVVATPLRAPKKAPIVRQGYATAKGAFKATSQDFFVASCSSHAVHSAVVHENNAVPCVVSCVFDGHGGEQAARFAQQAMLDTLMEHGIHQYVGFGDYEATTSAFRSAYSRVDEAILTRARESGQVDGTTALVTLQLGPALAVANAGDSRAVLCREGRAVRLSRDHTPAHKDERARIEAAGGRVAVARGAVRVLVPVGGVIKAISVSRGFGDLDFKAHNLVICEPDVILTELQEGRDGFVILASDGLWSCVSDQVAVDAVQQVMDEYSKMSPQHHASMATAAAKRLVRLAQDCGSLDDITVIVNVLHWD